MTEQNYWASKFFLVSPASGFQWFSSNKCELLRPLGTTESVGKPGGRLERIFSSEISHSACASIFDMLHSFAPRYSHPSIRHLQPSLMPGLCKSGQKRGGCSRTQTFLKKFRCQLRQANMKNSAGPKVRAKTFLWCIFVTAGNKKYHLGLKGARYVCQSKHGSRNKILFQNSCKICRITMCL